MPPVPVFNVGSGHAVSDLRVRTFSVRDGSASPTSPDPSPVVADLGNQDVAIGGLPAASSGESLVYVLYDLNDASTSLYQGAYGPDPAPAAVAPSAFPWPSYILATVLAYVGAPILVRCWAAGLEDDPRPVTGVTFDLWRVGVSSQVIAGLSATAEVTVDPGTFRITYSATIPQDRSASLTPGAYFGRFTLVGASGTLTAPPSEALRVLISSGAPPAE